ncbi:MAG: hypothetical protein RL596_1702, partial [Bacteroidota bacterium]
VNNIEVAPARTNAQFNFGMGYSLDEGQNIQVYSSIEVLGDRTATLGVSYSF